ncbi:hypothetical protein PHLCEN_2v7292 [Hermanssonia centrifuga]|uniref:Thioester reductase (TE) domain-containing protein n=1 Tax=Hermanssonia centrifuga TaxID=98765 RepID=A0A2R6NXL3_9APHY|nr:hypothetical protein PHLCEN_2v7292 [Hermanssonia centrifuga]
MAAVTDLRTRIAQGGMVSDKDWNPLTKDQALSPGASEYVVYAVEKTLAERAVWNFIDKHPHVELTTYANISALSTNSILYDLIRPDGPLPRSPGWVDVRDVAKALVVALRAPPASEVGRKRIIMGGEWFSPMEYLAEVRPELKDRLSEEVKRAGPVPKSIIDNTRAKEILGMEVTPWKCTLVEAIDDIVRLEKEWTSKDHSTIIGALPTITSAPHLLRSSVFMNL